MKFILGALAAVSLLAGVAVSQPASAQERCAWNGYTWQCWHRHHWWRHHHHWGWHHYWR